MSEQLPTEMAPASRLLTAAEFHRLADVPPEVEWFANLSNPSTRRAYENAIRDFMRFTAIVRPEEFRTVTRAHIIAWRNELARRGLGGGTIRHRLASLASLFEYLCEKNAVTHNPVKGVERPSNRVIERNWTTQFQSVGTLNQAVQFNSRGLDLGIEQIRQQGLREPRKASIDLDAMQRLID
jgi:hypothetical protein